MSDSEYDVAGWIDAIGNLHASTAENAADARAAYEAMAVIWSGYGYQAELIDVQRMLVTATEIGYLAALNDLRAGHLDDEIRQSRPDLTAP